MIFDLLVQAVIFAVLAVCLGSWLAIRRWRGKGSPSRGRIVLGTYMLVVAGFLVNEIVLGSYFALFGTVYSQDPLESLRRFALVGSLGLGIHVYMLANVLFLDVTRTAVAFADRSPKTGTWSAKVGSTLKYWRSRPGFQYGIVALACLAGSATIFMTAVAVKVSMDTAFGSAVVAFSTLFGAYVGGRIAQARHA